MGCQKIAQKISIGSDYPRVYGGILKHICYSVSDSMKFQLVCSGCSFPCPWQPPSGLSCEIFCKILNRYDNRKVY